MAEILALERIGGVANETRALSQLLGEKQTQGSRREDRAGSLRSLNHIAAHLGLNLLENLVAGRLVCSTWLRLQVDQHGIPSLQTLSLSALNPRCPLCTATDMGDLVAKESGIGVWRREIGKDSRPVRKGGIIVPRVFLTQEEWRAFWEREYTVLFQVAKAMLRNEEDAKDAVHDVFVSFDRSAHHGREIELGEKTFEEAVRAYLIGIVRNKAYDIWRQRRRQVNLVQKVQQQPAQGNLGPQQQISRWSLQKLAEKLPPREKELLEFLLDHVEHHPDDYWSLWAEKHGLDPADETARNTFDQLRRRLRKRLRDLGV